MSADFWAGYLSGAVGIIIGNPLDLIKVRLQARDAITAQTVAVYARQFETTASLVSGTAAPVLGYGALNALLFVSYNRVERALDAAFATHNNLWNTWLAGAAGGLASWVVSTPTELVKCRAQMSSPPRSSWAIAKGIWTMDGTKGFYFGGAVTALRDSIGYGFYFWAYELSNRWVSSTPGRDATPGLEASRVLFCGGLAGIVTWASIFPLDVIKTRVQTQPFEPDPYLSPILQRESSTPHASKPRPRRFGAIQAAKDACKEGGVRVFFKGLTVCSIRAFIVNAVQWAVYEWTMHALGHGRNQRRLASSN